MPAGAVRESDGECGGECGWDSVGVENHKVGQEMRAGKNGREGLGVMAGLSGRVRLCGGDAGYRPPQGSRVHEKLR